MDHKRRPGSITRKDRKEYPEVTQLAGRSVILKGWLMFNLLSEY